MSSSSSESDEEEKKKLASVVNCYHASTHQKNNTKKEDNARPGTVVSQKKSLREDRDASEAEHIMRTTPEFRNFVSKKLDAFFEQEIGFEVPPATAVNGHEGNDSGVRLLLKSQNRLNSLTFDVEDGPKRKKLAKKCHSSSSDSDSDEDERLRSAAVSSEFVLKDTAVKAHKLLPQKE